MNTKNSIFTNQLAVMAKMQAEHNRKVHAEWETQGHRYYRAIWVECAELLDPFGWKWWKKQDIDMEQVKLEVVDIWHFGLSDLIRDTLVGQDLVEQMVSQIGKKGPDFREAVETLARCSLEDPKFNVDAFCNLLNALPMSTDELYRIYIGKNVLNLFRQEHGYQTGDYRKKWNGLEDNQHLAEIVEELDSEDSRYPEQIRKALADRYSGSNN